MVGGRQRLLPFFLILNMAITKDKKKQIIENLTEKIKGSESVVFVNFHGVSVTDANELREKLRSEDTGYTVVKKTLIKRALDTISPEGEMPVLDGEVAVSYGNDPVLPAKSLYEFSKGKEESFKLLGGILENRFLNADEVLSLAKIPSREVLYGQFVWTINAPVTGFVSVLNNTVGSLVNVLDQVAKAKS